MVKSISLKACFLLFQLITKAEGILRLRFITLRFAQYDVPGLSFAAAYLLSFLSPPCDFSPRSVTNER